MTEEQKIIVEYLKSNKQLLETIKDMIDYTSKLIKFYNEKGVNENDNG